MLGLIWAQAAGRVIGAGGAMPWHLPEDLAHFKKTTHGSPVIMGRRTWESFPERFRPLPGRRNIVISRTAGAEFDGAESAASLDAALQLTANGDAWVIGGGRLYSEALPLADRVVITEVDMSVDGDTFAPPLGAEWTAATTDPGEGWLESKTGLKYRIIDYARV